MLFSFPLCPTWTWTDAWAPAGSPYGIRVGSTCPGVAPQTGDTGSEGSLHGAVAQACSQHRWWELWEKPLQWPKSALSTWGIGCNLSASPSTDSLLLFFPYTPINPLFIWGHITLWGYPGELLEVEGAGPCPERGNRAAEGSRGQALWEEDEGTGML